MSRQDPGNRLSALRARARLTQKEVATLVGCSWSTVAKHESGDRGMTDTDIKAYARVYKVPTYEIFIDPSGGDPVEERVAAIATTGRQGFAVAGV